MKYIQSPKVLVRKMTSDKEQNDQFATIIYSQIKIIWGRQELKKKKLSLNIPGK